MCSGRQHGVMHHHDRRSFVLGDDSADSGQSHPLIKSGLHELLVSCVSSFLDTINNFLHRVVGVKVVSVGLSVHDEWVSEVTGLLLELPEKVSHFVGTG